MFSNFHFLYPAWLVLFIPLVVLVFYLFTQRSHAAKHAILNQLVDPALAPFVLTEKTKRNNKTLLWFFTLFSSMAIIAMAGPSWKKIENASYQKQQALVILFDLSTSMYANDVKPNRLTRARFELIDLLKHRKEGQTALIVYAGKPFTVSPLTDDVENIEAQAKHLSPNDMPLQGSHLADALNQALDLLSNTGFKEGQILVMTDEVRDITASNQIIEAAADQGYMTSFMALGTQEGAPVPLNGGGFLKDAVGNIVIPKTNIATIQTLATAGNGTFVQSTIDDADLNKLLPQLARSNKQENYKENEDGSVMAWQNEGIWLLLLLLPFFLFFIFRRSVLLSLFLVGFLLSPVEDVYAAEQHWWNKLWKTPDQQAAKALSNDDAEQAFEIFEDPSWKATAAYRAGNYEQAAKIYAQQNSAGNLYNLGNSHAMAGKYPEAIKAYEQALQQKPDHADAKHNLEAVKKHLQKQQGNQQQNSQEQETGGQENQQDSQPSEQEEEGLSEQEQGEQDKNQRNQSQQQGQDQNPSEQDQTQQDSADENESSGRDEMTEAERQAKEAAEKEQEALEQEMERMTAQQSEERQNEENADDKADAPADLLSESEREQAQATQQWLRRIPDDPSGLWRRKFLYQYRQQGNQPMGAGEPW
jgi:Ca-activated chloride channel family protein